MFCKIQIAYHLSNSFDQETQLYRYHPKESGYNDRVITPLWGFSYYILLKVDYKMRGPIQRRGTQIIPQISSLSFSLVLTWYQTPCSTKGIMVFSFQIIFVWREFSAYQSRQFKTSTFTVLYCLNKSPAIDQGDFLEVLLSSLYSQIEYIKSGFLDR